jgi:hypothetical protein
LRIGRTPVSDDDIELDFTYHALHRLSERFGLTFRELGKLCDNYFEAERSSTKLASWRIVIPFGFSLNTWKMAIPCKVSFIGRLDGSSHFTVTTLIKTALSDVEDNLAFTKVRTVHVSAVQFPKRISKYRNL